MKINVKRTIPETLPAIEIIQFLLKDRGIKSLEEFQNPPHPSKISLGDFFSAKKKFEKDWKKTIKLLKEIKKNKQTIVVYTDYDADGVTGGAVLWETLHKLGFIAMPYIPDRKKEGYGFSEKGIDHVVKEYDPALIISVDHGIVAHDQISYAKKQGVPIIVTDHHQGQDTNPKDAYAIFHTDKLSGSGVAYFFAKEIAKSFKSGDELKQLFDTDYLALASIGTIADLVPLVGPSRSVARYGLDAFQHIHRYGLKYMLQEAKVHDKKMTSYEIGFIIGPRINAFGRLEHAMDALRLLCTSSHDKAKLLAQRAGKINRNRQNIVKKAVDEAEKQVNPDDTLIILDSETWEEGIIGLIAGRIAQKFHRPTIVMTRANGFAKASARSLPGIDITKFLRDLKKLLVDVGGHTAAAGFTIKTENIETFIKKAKIKAKKEIKEKDLEKKTDVDIQMPLKSINLALARQLEQLEPFGMGNKKPLFYSKGTVKDIFLLGKLKSHAKVLLKDEDSLVQLMLFNKDRFDSIEKGDEINVVYSIEVNRWNGKEEVQGTIKWFRAT